MKLNKVFQAILNSIGFNSNTETYIKTSVDANNDYVETIGEIPVTSIVVGFEYTEVDFGLKYRFRVTKDIQQDSEGTWTWNAINLTTEIDKEIVCKQIGRQFWPNIFAV